MDDFAPSRLASSVAWRTASPAVSEPSVPTTIELNMSVLSSQTASRRIIGRIRH